MTFFQKPNLFTPFTLYDFIHFIIDDHQDETLAREGFILTCLFIDWLFTFTAVMSSELLIRNSPSFWKKKNPPNPYNGYGKINFLVTVCCGFTIMCHHISKRRMPSYGQIWVKPQAQRWQTLDFFPQKLSKFITEVFLGSNLYCTSLVYKGVDRIIETKQNKKELSIRLLYY